VLAGFADEQNRTSWKTLHEHTVMQAANNSLASAVLAAKVV
jgi:hypothetical protein